MKRYQNAIEEYLKQFPLLAQENEEPVTVVTEASPAEGFPPQPLRSAMRYSLLLPGKRIRPVLALEFCRICKLF